MNYYHLLALPLELALTPLSLALATTLVLGLLPLTLLALLPLTLVLSMLPLALALLPLALVPTLAPKLALLPLALSLALALLPLALALLPLVLALTLLGEQALQNNRCKQTKKVLQPTASVRLCDGNGKCVENLSESKRSQFSHPYCADNSDVNSTTIREHVGVVRLRVFQRRGSYHCM